MLCVTKIVTGGPVRYVGAAVGLKRGGREGR